MKAEVIEGHREPQAGHCSCVSWRYSSAQPFPARKVDGSASSLPPTASPSEASVRIRIGSRTDPIWTRTGMIFASDRKRSTTTNQQ